MCKFKQLKVQPKQSPGLFVESCNWLFLPTARLPFFAKLKGAGAVNERPVGRKRLLRRPRLSRTKQLQRDPIKIKDTPLVPLLSLIMNVILVLLAANQKLPELLELNLSWGFVWNNNFGSWIRKFGVFHK